jgi:hypothetical protein
VSVNEELWGFDNEGASRERFTTAPRGQTEMFSCRLYANNLRMLDEIIHSGLDPRLKTKSDCVQDAVQLFIEDWVEKYADGLSGRTLRMFWLEQRRAQQENRDNFLTSFDSDLETAKKNRDKQGLQSLLALTKAEREESKDSPPVYLEELDNRIRQLEELVRRETPE